MRGKTFQKKDEAFVCVNCGKSVSPLGYSSRNHCPHCLTSLHVDVFPGDRANDCKGLLRPVSMRVDGKKGYVISFVCEKCGAKTNNIAAEDDDFETLLRLSAGEING